MRRRIVQLIACMVIVGSAPNQGHPMQASGSPAVASKVTIENTINESTFAYLGRFIRSNHQGDHPKSLNPSSAYCPRQSGARPLRCWMRRSAQPRLDLIRTPLRLEEHRYRPRTRYLRSVRCSHSRSG